MPGETARLDAILWDFDGTLVNSARKNMDITRSILAVVAPRQLDASLPGFLRSESAYHEANHEAENWQDLYRKFSDLSEEEISLAGSLWAEHQERNQTEVPLFEGIRDLIGSYAGLPHGICSQNASGNIWSVLREHGIATSFKSVVGYEEVTETRQKPHASGGLKCLSEILGNRDAKQIMYIGDHEADVVFARNIEQASTTELRVISVSAAYSGADPDAWSAQADHVANRVSDLHAIIAQYV